MAEHAVKTKSRAEEEEAAKRNRRRRYEGGGGEGGERRDPRQTAVSHGHGAVCSETAETRLGEVFHVYGPADMSTLLPLSASQLIRTPPSARGTNKKR